MLYDCWKTHHAEELCGIAGALWRQQEEEKRNEEDWVEGEEEINL